jgi:hypothetical protein
MKQSKGTTHPTRLPANILEIQWECFKCLAANEALVLLLVQFPIGLKIVMNCKNV